MPPCPCGHPVAACTWPGAPLAHALPLGAVVVTEGPARDPISAGIRWATDSRWTHCFVVTGPDQLTEAWFPRARHYSLAKRMAEVQAQGRAYAVLDLPGITFAERCRLTTQVRDYKGRFYDVGQVALFALLRRFRQDGSGTLLCTRLVTAGFAEALGADLFPEAYRTAMRPGRAADLARGECTPADLLRSALVVRRFVPSAHVPTLP